MDVFEVMAARRSIRKYKSDPIAQDLIQKLLQAAMMAPSAKNERPWHFIVVSQEEMRNQLAKTSPYTHMAAKAPLNIVVAADMKEEKAPQMWVQDCAAATMNLLLAVTGLELGAVWCGVYPEQDRMKHISEILKLPENVVPFNLICIGFPDETLKPKDEFLEDRVHQEIW